MRCMHDRAAARSHLLRIGRYSERNYMYVTTAVTHKRKPILRELKVGRILVNSLRFQHSEQRAFTLAYVVMPDHFHWLLQLGASKSLAEVMHSVKSYSSNQIGQVTGNQAQRVWQAGFHDHAIRRDETLVNVARYIVDDPLRAGLVHDLGDFPFRDTLWTV